MAPRAYSFGPGPLAMSFMGVAVAVAHLVSVEVFGSTVPAFVRPVASMGELTTVAMIRMVVVVDIAVEVLRAMKPGAGADEDTTAKPLGAVVTVGSAMIGRDIVVAVGTRGSNTDVDVD